ncbi:single-stranded DNA-binding protein [candidate division WWE3 bacterium CG08_land_8_20_14_0_20_40_13]|uniref:Single-stranded DNA-binding protein n=1 Tax=candidate division WWE3 bacterium CG08_land_8_20_14_0_20_40_13 TaxID=1975084 RepID=A0A2H0XD66_UNCKA|nr:MAG: single-stranded DNA-binding protein [candidate division WWE3 bacterium CG08_land_8_20_14_0_20_40_13]
MSRSINQATILGNLTRDPEMRYTPSGAAVTSFGVATNRSWKTQDGSVREETEFHNIVAWNKLAELCSQLLQKGTRVYVQGRLQTRSWDDTSGAKHYKTEVIADDMVVLDRMRPLPGGAVSEEVVHDRVPEAPESPKEEKPQVEELKEDVAGEEIPF